MRMDDVLIFSSEEEYNRIVKIEAQNLADIADEWVMQKMLVKHKEFKSSESVKSGGRTIFYIDAPFDLEDTSVFLNEEVKINGKRYIVAGVEKHCVSLIQKGTTIGLMVK